MSATMQKILEELKYDIKRGVVRPCRYYLKYFPPTNSKEEERRRVDRIYKMASRNNLSFKKRDFNPAEESKIGIPGVTIQDYQDLAEKSSDITKKIQNFQYDKSFKFHEPIILAPMGDHHIGSSGTDFPKMMKDFQFIVENDIKIILEGDFSENKLEFNKNLEAVLSQSLSPDMQYDCTLKILDSLKDQILVAISGNHDSHNRGHGCRNLLKEACNTVGISFHGGFAKIIIDIDGAVYEVLANHRPKGRSAINPLHGVYKLMDVDECDIYCAAHIHKPACSIHYRRNRKRICLISGTYNTEALYSLEQYDPFGAKANFPCVLLMPGTKEMILFWDMRQAVKYRDMIIKERNDFKD